MIELIKYYVEYAEGFELGKQSVGKPYLWYTEDNENKIGMKIEEVQNRFLWPLFLQSAIEGVNDESKRFTIMGLCGEIRVHDLDNTGATQFKFFNVATHGGYTQAKEAALNYVMGECER